MRWFYVRDQDAERLGPFDDEPFQELVRDGTVTATTLVWNDTLTDWVAYGTLPTPDSHSEPARESAPAEGEQGATVAPLSSEAGAGPSAEPESDRANVRKGPHAFFFDCKGGDILLLYLKNVALTLLTLGVHRFWAKVAIRRFNYQHTTFLEGRFDYHATGKERFLGFLKALVILSPLLALLVGLYFWLAGSGVQPNAAATACVYAFFFIILFLRPLIVVGSMRFNLSRTSWRGMRFLFDGRMSDAYALYLRDGVLMVLTLGFYHSFHHVNVRRFKAHHSRFGDERFDFRGTGWEYLGLTIGGFMLSYMTLGFFVPWFIAMVNRYHIDNLWFQGARFQSTLTGMQVLKVFVVGVLVTVGTLGLGFPWAVKLYLEAYTNSISYTGDLDLDALRGSYDASSTALIEGIGEAGEALEALGDFLGG